jgi:tRNA-uridine 2-sulfurtransferase
MKIMVAMSGGVDSSVAAALLKREGHEVIGATMELFGDESPTAAAEDANKVAEALGIPHLVYDFRSIFSATIIEDFCKEYAGGHTPNPCVLCNRFFKFGLLWEKAYEEGADRLATGHYAGILKQDNSYLLQKGADRQKDQSYFLYRLTPEQLSHTLFPLAALTKSMVKEMAEQMELPAAGRPESQEICFVTEDDYAGLVEEHLNIIALPGPILDSAGKTIGQHHGITHYTIGQRKGLNISSPEPLYVTGIDARKNAIIVGKKEEIYATELTAENLNWITGAPAGPTKVQAKVRYRAPEAEALITPTENDKEFNVKFTAPQMAVTPGQSVVFYDGDTVIGGGIIARQGR